MKRSAILRKAFMQGMRSAFTLNGSQELLNFLYLRANNGFSTDRKAIKKDRTFIGKNMSAKQKEALNV